MDLCCREMVKNILGPVVDSDTELVRYDVHHALPNNTNSLIGTDLFSWSVSSLISDILEVRLRVSENYPIMQICIRIYNI